MLSQSPDFLLYSTLPFLDSFDNAGTVFTVSYSSAVGIGSVFSDAFLTTDDLQTDSETRLLQFQVMGCTVNLRRYVITTDLDAHSLMIPSPWLQTESRWLPFVPSVNDSHGSTLVDLPVAWSIPVCVFVCSGCTCRLSDDLTFSGLDFSTATALSAISHMAIMNLRDSVVVTWFSI